MTAFCSLADKIDKLLYEHGINAQIGELGFLLNSNAIENSEYLKTNEGADIRGCGLVIENRQLIWKCS